MHVSLSLILAYSERSRQDKTRQWWETDAGTGASISVCLLYTKLIIKLNFNILYIFDRSPVPANSALKSYSSGWSLQYVSKRVLKVLTDSASTILLGKLFQVLIVRAVNEYIFVSRNENSY